MLHNLESGGPSGTSLSPEALLQLQTMEQVLRKHWRLGQNMVLCWAPTPRGLLTVVVPHFFLGNYTAQPAEGGAALGNELFIREVIGGSRLKSEEQIFAIAKRLGVSTSFIKLDQPLAEEPGMLEAADGIIARYGMGYVEARAVLLFDIAGFSLYSPFEQASQLNSLSYSMNSAYSKLQRQGVDVNFARTTTGDGYYVWNRDLGAFPNLDLLSFLLLVLIDNAVARREASGNTVPVIRSAYHVGSHYELFQAEGVNPTVFSYIVGDVTIALARMLDSAEPGQVLLGDFESALPRRSGLFSPREFLDDAIAELSGLSALQIAGQPLRSLTSAMASDGSGPIHIVDKHGLELTAFNLELTAEIGDDICSIGVPSP